MVLAETLPHRTLFGISMVGDSRANLLFIVFVAVFLCSSIPLARSLLSKIDLSAAPAPRVARRPPAKPVEKLKPKTEPVSLDMKKDAEDETEDRVKLKKKKKKKPKDQAAEKEDTDMDFVEEDG